MPAGIIAATLPDVMPARIAVMKKLPKPPRLPSFKVAWGRVFERVRWSMRPGGLAKTLKYGLGIGTAAKATAKAAMRLLPGALAAKYALKAASMAVVGFVRTLGGIRPDVIARLTLAVAEVVGKLDKAFRTKTGIVAAAAFSWVGVNVAEPILRVIDGALAGVALRVIDAMADVVQLVMDDRRARLALVAARSLDAADSQRARFDAWRREMWRVMDYKEARAGGGDGHVVVAGQVALPSVVEPPPPFRAKYAARLESFARAQDDSVREAFAFDLDDPVRSGVRTLRVSFGHLMDDGEEIEASATATLGAVDELAGAVALDLSLLDQVTRGSIFSERARGQVQLAIIAAQAVARSAIAAARGIAEIIAGDVPHGLAHLAAAAAFGTAAGIAGAAAPGIGASSRDADPIGERLRAGGAREADLTVIVPGYSNPKQIADLIVQGINADAVSGRQDGFAPILPRRPSIGARELALASAGGLDRLHRDSIRNLATSGLGIVGILARLNARRIEREARRVTRRIRRVLRRAF